MPFKLGWQEILLILVIVLLIFAVGKLPQIKTAIREWFKRFRRAKSAEDTGEENKAQNIAESTEHKKQS